MSAPPAPNCIAEALRAEIVGFDDAEAHSLAQAVWDALLAEGRIEPREIYVNGFRRDSTVLVVPLPGAPQHNTHA